MKRGGPIARRAGLKRSGPLRSPGPRPDPGRVAPAEAAHVLARDGYQCVLYVLVPGHRCAGGITLDHVPCRGRNAMGKRANGDRYHLATACREANVEGDVSALRDVERDHIEAREGPHAHELDGATIRSRECGHDDTTPEDEFAHTGTCSTCGAITHNSLLEPGGSRHAEALPNCTLCTPEEAPDARNT